MSRRSSWHLARMALLLAMSAIEPFDRGYGEEIKGEQTLFLEVTVNGTSTNLIAEFRLRAHDRLATRKSELTDIGLKPDPRAAAADGLLDLDQLPGVTYSYDKASQTVRIEALASSQLPHRMDARANTLRGTITPDLDATRRASGVVLNYFAFGTTDTAFGQNIAPVGRRSAASVTLDGRLFGDYGVVAQSAIVGATPQENGDAIRLNTTWSYADADSLVTYRAGDVISGGLTWTRPIRLGGIEAQRSFSLRPDLVTMPLPAFSGTAAVPSSVDVFVNSVRTFSQQIPAGPFEITNLPVVSGAGTQSLVVRDATGRESVTSQPFYATPKLLREGLYDFSVESGFRRYGFGVASDDYDGDLVASASLRGGITDALTVEGHAEGGAGLANAGIGTVFPLAAAGVGSIALAGSTTEATQGGQAAASIEYDLGVARFFARGQQTFGNYTDLAAAASNVKLSGLPATLNVQPPRQLYQTALTIPFAANASSLALSFTHLRGEFDLKEDVLGVTYTRSVFRDASMFVNGFKDLGPSHNLGILAGITFALRPDISARADISANNGSVVGGVELIKTQPQEPDTYGWRLRDREGDVADRAASLSYRTQDVRIAVGAQQFGPSSQATGEVEGAIAAINGGVFLTNRIDDAFAVVDAGAPGVDVTYENRPAGRTNEQGQLLVPRLHANDTSWLTIDPNSLPVDAVVPRTKIAVKPSDRGAVVADFGVTTGGNQVLVTLRDALGHDIPVGSRVTVEGTDQTLPVGYDGKVYLQKAARDVALRVERSDKGSCRATLTLAEHPNNRLASQEAICR
jgi:outer membrane usher protein